MDLLKQSGGATLKEILRATGWQFTVSGDLFADIWERRSHAQSLVSFAAPSSDFVLGNGAQRYTQLRERAERNVDLAIAKTFTFTERFSLQFRGEGFNIFNYAQYNLSAFNSFPLCVSCGNFGDLNSTERSEAAPVQPQAAILRRSLVIVGRRIDLGRLPASLLVAFCLLGADLAEMSHQAKEAMVVCNFRQAVAPSGPWHSESRPAVSSSAPFPGRVSAGLVPPRQLPTCPAWTGQLTC